MSKVIYRGYEIEHDATKGWLVSLDGEFQCAQPSEDFALSWIDRDRRERVQKEGQSK